MNVLSQSPAVLRSPRVKLPNRTPVVLRLRNGSRSQGELEVVSLTGGLLQLRKPLIQGARVSLMFLTQSGPVIGAAEMLIPVSWQLQPFRFLELHADDQRRLRSTIQSSPEQREIDSAARPAITDSAPPPPVTDSAAHSGLDDAWIVRYRANLQQRTAAPKRKLLRRILTTFAVSILCLGGAIYLGASGFSLK